MEWKKDIELSIEKISEKVAVQNNSNTVVNLLEKRVDDTQQEFGKLRRETEESLDQASHLRKNFEKYEKSEKIINELITQISSVKTSNIKWQSDFLKNMNEYSEKLMSTEILIDQLDKQDKIIHKKMDAMQIDLKRKETNIMENFESSNEMFEKKLEDVYVRTDGAGLMDVLMDQRKISMEAYGLDIMQFLYKINLIIQCLFYSQVDHNIHNY